MSKPKKKSVWDVWTPQHARKAPVTYAEAKALFELAQTPSEGKPVPDLRGVRVHEVKGGFKFVYRGAARRRYYNRAANGGHAVDLFIIRRDGSFCFCAIDFYAFQGIPGRAMQTLTPIGYVGEGHGYWALRTPSTEPEPPRHASLPEVAEPRWFPKDSHYRKNFEEGVAKYGSLEQWHEAYHAWRKAEAAACDAWSRWLTGKTMQVFAGASCTREGVLYKRSIERHLQRERAEKRKRDAAMRKHQAQTNRAYARQKREQEAAEKAAARKLKSATGIEVSPEAASWLLRNGVVPNNDGTVTLVKAVHADYRSVHGALYEPGTTVIAEDYDGTPHCGGGLHFSHSAREAASSQTGSLYGGGKKPRFLLCKVELATLVAIDSYKVKAKSCEVIGEIDDDGTVVNQAIKHDDPKAIKTTALKSAAEQIADKMAKAARKAVESQ